MRWYLRIVMATTIGHESVVEDMMRDRDLVARRVAKEGDNWVGYGQFRETEDDPLSELEQRLEDDDDVVEYETRRSPFPGEPVGIPVPRPPVARSPRDGGEAAMLAGMEWGCEGYNEAMGCSLEPPPVTVTHGTGCTAPTPVMTDPLSAAFGLKGDSMKTATITLSRQAVQEANAFLNGTKPKSEAHAGVLTFTAKFEGGAEADIKVVLDADEPYLDPVLFDEHGREVMCIQDDSTRIEGEYRFDLADGTTYIVEIATAG